MTETIRVFYSPQINFAGVITYHETLLYTNSTGQQFIASAGPAVDPRKTLGLSDPQAALQPLTSSTSDWGKLQAATGPIGTFTADQLNSWLGNSLSNPNDTVISSSGSLQSQWNAITAAAANINAGNFQYSPLSLNSNSAVATELSAAGLSQPAASGFLQSHYAPAGTRILPVPGVTTFNPFATSIVASGGNQQVVVTDSSSGATYILADSANTTYEEIKGTVGGKNTLWISGNGANVSINNTAVNVAAGASNNFTGAGNTFNDAGSDTLGVAGGNNSINGAAGDTIYISGTSSTAGDGVTANSATINTAQSSYLTLNGGANTLNDAGSSVLYVNGNGNADTLNLNINNAVGLGGTVFLGTNSPSNITGGGNEISETSGTGLINLSFTHNMFDSVLGTASYSNTIGLAANTQANVSAQNADIKLSTGDSLGASGSDQIVTTATGNLVSDQGTGLEIYGNNDQGGGTTGNGQPTGIAQNQGTTALIYGSGNTDFSNSQATTELYAGANTVNVTGGQVGLVGVISSTVEGNANTLFTGSNGAAATIGGTKNLFEGSGASITLNSTGSIFTINGNNDSLNAGSNNKIAIQGQDDSSNGNPTDSTTFYGPTTGDGTSGGEGVTYSSGQPPADTSVGYGYGIGFDFVKGKLPSSSADVAAIGSFDKSFSEFSAGTNSSSDATAGTINSDVEGKAWQSALNSANGTSTLGDTLEGGRWNASVITWSFGSTAFDAPEQAAIESAFSAWSAVSGVKFEHVAEGQSSDINLNFNNLDTASTGVIGFTSYKSSEGTFEAGTSISLEDPTDTALGTGPQGQLTYTGAGVTLYQVALHEIGHALGLNDTDDVNSVMYYGSSSSNQQLDATDIANAQLIYGAPMASKTSTTSAVSAAAPPAVQSKDASPATAAANVRGSANTQAAALTTPSDASVNQLIQSIAAFKGSSSAASGPSLLSPDEHPLHLAARYTLSA